MLYTNLNTFSIIIFIIILMIVFFLASRSFFDYRKSGNKILFLSNICLIISIIILSIGLFGPKKILNSTNNYTGTNIVFVLDVSKSMQAYDVKDKNGLYSRLDASKIFIQDFMIKYPGNKYALVAFAGESVRVLPFTSDTNLFSTILAGVDSNNVSIQGTDLIGAIKQGLKNFDSENKSGVIVLISDGDDEKKLNLEQVKDDIKFLVIGVGTQEGSFIPIGRGVFGDVTYKTYNGERVVTKLDEKNLKNIANFYNGNYTNLKDIGNFSKLNNILDNVSKQTFIEDNENSMDLKRYLSIFSFVFFFLYLLFLLINNVKAKF